MPDIITGKIFVDGEKGITATKLNQIQSLAVIQPDFVGTKPATSSIAATDQLLILQTANVYARAPFSAVSTSVAGSLPVADNTQNGMMRQVSGNTTDVIDGTNHSVPIASMPGITQMRMRSFNAIGNSTFEVGQQDIGAVVTIPAGGTPVRGADRWFPFRTAATTLTATSQRIVTGQMGGTSQILVPGTNFTITNTFLRITLTGVQASLAATDSFSVSHYVEGSKFRELQNDVHSIQLLVRSSVANLTFGLGLRDPGTTRSLTKLCTLGAANTWTLITLPNLPVWSAAGGFTSLAGSLGYYFNITLAAGTSLVAPANDTWQNGNFIGALSQANFANSALNSTFDIAFCQHEPGAICTTPIDLQFIPNLDECLRYFQKSWPYATAIGTSGANSFSTWRTMTAKAGAFNSWGGPFFGKPMAKAPTATIYNHATGAINSSTCYYATSGTIPTGTSTVSVTSTIATEKGISTVGSSGTSTSELILFGEWTADTGW